MNEVPHCPKCRAEMDRVDIGPAEWREVGLSEWHGWECSE